MLKQNNYPRISGVKVLKSNAGYYIGKVYMYSEDEHEPFSRDSGYYPTREEAEKALANNDYFRA